METQQTICATLMTCFLGKMYAGSLSVLERSSHTLNHWDGYICCERTQIWEEENGDWRRTKGHSISAWLEQIFYLLSNGRRSRKVRDIAIVRLEQIAPFPFDRLAMVINRYPKAQLVWVQVYIWNFMFKASIQGTLKIQECLGCLGWIYFNCWRIVQS